MSWNNLSMRERADVMRLAIENGIYDLDTIRAGYNSFAEGGDIHISPSKKGTFTAAASKHNMGVQEFASKVLANKDDYSTAMVRKANFARNAKSWRHDLGGELIQAAQEGGIKYLGRRSSRYDDGGSKSDWRDNHVYEAGSLPEIVVNSENTDATPKKHFVRYNEDGNPVYTTDYSLSQNALNNLLPEGEATRRRRNWTLENVGSNGIQRPGLHGYAQDIANYAEIGIGGALAPLVISHFAPTVGKVALNTFNAAGDAVVESPLGQLAKSFFTNPYVDAALTSLGGAHAAQSIANGEANAMTALELLPMTRVIKPAYRAVKSFVGPEANSLKGPIVESANASQTMEQLDAAYAQAVAKGNRPEALRILEQAYLRSGVPQTEITMTPEGRALGWFHGAEWGNHTIFDSSAMNATIGGTSAAGRVKGNFLTTDLPSAARYAGQSSRYSSMPDPKETSPSTFLEKLQNLFGKYKPRTFYPAERVGDMAPRAERLFDTKGQPPISHISKVDRVVYPMYVNPGNNPMILDFEGRPWSSSPVEFPNNFYLKKWIRDDVAKTYKEEIVPFESKEEAMAAWKADPINIRRGNTDLEKEYFDDDVRYIEGFNSAPRYEKVKLVEERVPNTTNGAVQTAAKKGNSSVLIRNVIDSNGGPNGVHYAIDDFVTLKPEQMKLADVTYDDEGKLIPLLKRFDWKNKDTRYGLLPWFLGAATVYGTSQNKKSLGGYFKSGLKI